MARTAKRYKKNTEEKIPGIPVCMAAIYARLSVDNDEKKSESIETQVTLIKEFIQKHNENPDKEYEIAVYDIYSDLGKTGTNFDRPGFERMMNDVRAGKINCILVKDFSRFGRNYIETGNYLEKILPFMKVRFISVCDNYDSFAPDAKNQELSIPLLLVRNIGIVSFLISVVLSVCYLVRYYTLGISVQGWTSLMLVMLAFFGLILLSIGIMGIYLMNILNEAKKMPHYVIRREDTDE